MKANELDLIRSDFIEDPNLHFKDANEIIHKQTNIQNFFSNNKEFFIFKKFILNEQIDSPQSKQWGDVQTPIDFVQRVYTIIKKTGFKPDIIIEPTCGKGNFLIEALYAFPKSQQIYGVEIQKELLWVFMINLLARVKKSEKSKWYQTKIILENNDIFSHVFPISLREQPTKNFLVIGNPPWITASEMSKLNLFNLPTKSNIKKFPGIAAITGKSNFDISENIIVKMIENFSEQNGKLVFLCKTSVIRNILKIIPSKNWRIGNIQAIQFDAKKVFGKVCDASLLLMDLNTSKKEVICAISNIEKPNETIRCFGWVKDKFVADIDKYQKTNQFDGKASFNWRQGVKHDASRILELREISTNLYKNKLDEELTIEDNLVYPLLKGSDIRNFEPKDKMKRILLPQKSLRDNTEKIKDLYPKTWQYLTSKINHFKKRKSRVYTNKNEFAIFGIGDYAFTPFKVAICGFYKEPHFALLQPIENKPVIVDDTSYYLGFEMYNEALFVATVLNSKLSREFFESIVFLDTKRPFTKELLMRLDVNKIISNIEFDELEEIWNELDYNNPTNINSTDFKNYKKRINE